jgi:hypothetical protein
VVATGQVDGGDAVERRRVRSGVGEVADHPVDARGQFGGRVADQRPHGQAAAGELGYEVAADGAGRADREDGCHGATVRRAAFPERSSAGDLGERGGDAVGLRRPHSCGTTHREQGVRRRA